MTMLLAITGAALLASLLADRRKTLRGVRQGLKMFASIAPALLGVLALTSLVMAFEQGIFGLIIVLFLIFEPDGLAHRWKLMKAYWKLYPFSY